MLEIAANSVTALAIFLAGRNSIHTWWLGIIGCGLFGALFYDSQLYADFTLQGFFIITSIIGWYRWAKGDAGDTLPITRARPVALAYVSLRGWRWLRLTHFYWCILQTPLRRVGTRFC
jgi:nicotinamide mononucleotide transporter